MTRYRDSRRSGSHWHVDCRIEGELPEDHLVSPRFFINLLFASTALVLSLIFGWFSYRTFNLTHQIREWDQRIQRSSAEVMEIQRMQREFVAEASKVDQAYGVIRPSLFVSEFVTVLSRTLPSQINVELLERNDDDIVMRGTIRDTSQRASRLLVDYIEVLRKDPKIAARFRNIKVTAFERAKVKEEMQNFGITFRLQPLPPFP
jgi:hypothetical protein